MIFLKKSRISQLILYSRSSSITKSMTSYEVHSVIWDCRCISIMNLSTSDKFLICAESLDLIKTTWSPLKVWKLKEVMILMKMRVWLKKILFIDIPLRKSSNISTKNTESCERAMKSSLKHNTRKELHKTNSKVGITIIILV